MLVCILNAMYIRSRIMDLLRSYHSYIYRGERDWCWVCVSVFRADRINTFSRSVSAKKRRRTTLNVLPSNMHETVYMYTC